MSRIVVYSDYLKSGDKKHILNDFEYIGTREGVCLNQFDYAKYMKPLHPATQVHPVTERQQELINSILKEIPDAKEMISYEKFESNANMYHASMFIAEAMELLETKTCDNHIYMKYISERPGVVIKEGCEHGLFDTMGAADYDHYYHELDQHKGNVWRHIVSMRREDAIANDYESQEAWRDLINNNMKQLAADNGIPFEHLRWIAAFHDEGHHPHCHIMSWSTDPKEGFQNKEALINFRKALTKDVFANEIWLREQYKAEIRDSFENTFESEFLTVMDNMMKATDKELEPIMTQISEIANMLPYKHCSYGYLPSECKSKINRLVKDVVTLPQVHPLLEKYLESHRILGSMYMNENSIAMNKYLESSLQKLIAPDKADRKKLHNYIVKTVYDYRQRQYMNRSLLALKAAEIDQKIKDPIYQENNSKLGGQLIKLFILEGKDPTEIITTVQPFYESRDDALLYYLDMKDDSTLSYADISAIKRHFNLLNDIGEAVIQDNMPLHEAAKIFQYILTFMQEGKMNADQEAHRLFIAHRLIERDAKIQQAKK